MSADEAAMRKLAARLAAVLAFVVLAAPVQAEAPADTSKPAQQESQQPEPREFLDHARQIVVDNFYNLSDLAAFETMLASERKDVQTLADAESAIMRALPVLKASHTARYTPDQIEYYELMDVFRPAGTDRQGHAIVPGGSVDYAGIGMVARKIDGRLFIAQIYHGSTAQRAGLEIGDEIVAVDGKPYQPIASFKDRAGQTVTVTIRRTADAAPLDIAVPVVWIQPNASLREAIRSSARTIEHNGQRIGYLRVWTYAAGRMHSLLTEMIASETLRNADGLVLDLRSRWGGSASEAADLFLGRSRDMTIIDRDGQEKVVVARWRKPLVAIIDQGTRSSMEIFAQALQQAAIPLIGSHSAGAVLAGRGFILKDNSLLVLAVNDVRIDGQRLENVGVSPDIEVPYDIRYSAGADPQFDRAVAELSRRLIH
jgi:carboxyl-terminal processing protease